jgi:hypothetical protein
MPQGDADGLAAILEREDLLDAGQVPDSASARSAQASITVRVIGSRRRRHPRARAEVETTSHRPIEGRLRPRPMP